ncbi:MAG TPA: hypothetical protein VFX96_01400, partial [Pyrinomonadaceae bacterium]|nr:hypothetical protein [Pyrinomonadaceae bacterium]
MRVARLDTVTRLDPFAPPDILAPRFAEDLERRGLETATRRVAFAPQAFILNSRPFDFDSCAFIPAARGARVT